ncbi:protein NLRC5-like [Branchiostoma lanceolatum]|uniref:protein NLRC5-like n=1 Tax=Branchiostoma lanceolatum TaxID=7740 RepID=UPI00345399F4
MWERLASSLGFNTDYIRDLTARLPPSLRPHQLICDWMERNDGDVTLDQLVQALRDAGIHEVADAVDSGQLFLTEAECEAAKGKPDEGMDTGDEIDSGRLFGKGEPDGDMETDSPDGEDRSNDRSPGNTDSVTSALVSNDNHSNLEGGDTSLTSVSTLTTVSPPMYPTGEDALAWNDCLQDFFKTDEDTARVIQESWPSNLLVKHLIRDRFFHSYLCEYWKQYQTSPGTVAAFVEFVTKASAKKFCTERGISNEKFKSLYKGHCLVVGKAAFKSQSNNLLAYVYKDQLAWGFVRQSGFGWLIPVDSNEASDAFQFVHDSIRQFLMAMWVAHAVGTQTDCTKLLRFCAENSDQLPLTCYSLAYLLGMTDSPPTYLYQFVTLLMKRTEESNFNHILSIVATIAESKQVHALSSLTQNLFPDRSLNLSALPEISRHGLRCLKKLIRNTTLILDLSHNNISDKVVPSLAEVLASCQNLKKVNLSYNKLSDRGDFLPPLPNLEEIDISHNNISDKVVPSLAEVLASCQNLKKVDLSHNKLSDSGDFLPPLPNLEEIDVSHNAISDEAVPNLVKVVASCRNMRTVNLNNNHISNKGALLLLQKEQYRQKYVQVNVWENTVSGHLVSILINRTDASQIVKLDLTSRPNDASLPTSAVHLLLRFLPQLPILRELAICVSCQREGEVEHINQLYALKSLLKTLKLTLMDWSLEIMTRLLTLMLGHFPLLEAIDLSGSDIRDEAAPALAQGLTSCQNLRKVNLSHNKLSDRGDFLPPLSNLEEIDLSYNALRNEAVPSLAKGVPSCPNLKRVDLRFNKLSDMGDFLTSLPNLEEIDLSHNDISDEAVPGLAKGLASCQNLKKVHLTNNKISNKGALMLLLQNQCKQMQLKTAGNNISDDLVSLLSNSQNASHVAKLFLMPGEYPRGNVPPLSFTAVNLLLQFLPQLPNLQELALCVSCQGEEEAELIDQLYEVQPPLKTLKLRLRDWSFDNMTRLLTPMLKQFPLLEEIDISNNGFSDEAAPGLAEGLGSCWNLKKVDLSYNKLSNRGDFLPPLPKMEEIDLSHSDICDEAVPALAKGLGSCQNLKKVHLTNNKISNKGALMLLLQDQCKQMQLETAANNISDDLVSLFSDRQSASQAVKLFLMPGEYPWGNIPPLPFTAVTPLLQFLPQLPNLQELALCVSCQKEEAVLIDQLNRVQPPLKTLKLKLRDWSLDMITRLLKLVLQQFPLLEVIDLSGNDISDVVVPALAQSLGSCQNLKKVALSHNDLSERGDFLPPLPNLEEIDFSHNDISDEAVPSLAKGLASCQNLKKVNLTNNKISNKGALMLLLQDQCKQMQLETAGNNICDDLVSLLSNRQNASQVAKLFLMPGDYPRGNVPLLPFTAVNLLLQFLPQLPNLQELALCVSCRGEEEAELIDQLYEVQPLLKTLKLTLRDLSLDKMTRLLTLMLQQFPLLEEIDLSNNGLSDEAVPGLAEGLGSCQNLKKVNLSHNKLSNRGDFLPPLPKMEEIDLCHSDICDEAVPALAKGLGSCQNLKKVNLTNNKISNKGALMLLLQDQCKQMQLETAGNNISDDLVSLLSNSQNASQVAKLFLMPGEYPRGNVPPLSFTAVNLLLQFLPQLPNLQELALCVSCRGEEEAEHIDQLYEVQPPLKTLKLSLRDWSLDNMTRLLTPMLKQFPLLEEIDLSNNGFSDEAVPGLAEGLGSCQNLKKVDLSYYKLSDSGDFLPPLPNLEEIDLSHNALSDESVPALVQGFGTCQNLKKVDLLCLGSCQKLKRLNLSFNNLSDKGDFLPPLPNLEEIDLSHNALSDESVPALVQGFGTCQNLKKVDFSHNNLYCTRNFLPPLPKLEEIDISHNAVSGEAVTGLAEGLGSCLELKKVNLSHNNLSDVVELIEAFTTLPILTHVNIDDNFISDEYLPTIAAWLKVRTDVEVVNLYGNRFSAEGVRDFVRTMKGKAYGLTSGDLLYDGSQADVGDIVESGGEDVRREEQQWERLRRQTDWTPLKVIPVTVRQRTIWINHRGPRSNNAQQMSPKAGFDECPALPICLKPS